MPIEFQLKEAAALLSRTPATVRNLLADLPEAWLTASEGPKTFSAWDVVAHLLHGERTDWMPRLRIILEHGEGRPFEPFDRVAHRAESAGLTIGELLDAFAAARARNLAELEALGLDEAALARTGTHPELGRVTARELLATWVVHDLGHIRQIARVLARQYAGVVGPWREYLPVLRQPRDCAAGDAAPKG